MGRAKLPRDPMERAFAIGEQSTARKPCLGPAKTRQAKTYASR